MIDPNIVPEVTYSGPGGTVTIHKFAPDREHTRAVLKAMGTATTLDVTATESQRKIDPNR